MSGAQSKCLFVPLARFQRSQGEDKTSLCSQCEIRLNQLGGGGGGEGVNARHLLGLDTGSSKHKLRCRKVLVPNF